MLTCHLYDPYLHPSELAEKFFAWGRQFSPRRRPRSRPAGERIRLGYLAGNFCASAESFFTLPLLQNHSTRKFEVFAYSNGDVADARTNLFKRAVHHWRDIQHLSDHQAAQLIRADRLDLLVDLSGHWLPGRVSVLARRPAPLQISYPIFPATTGLTAVDYRLTDADADPPGLTEAHHTETLLRLPRCYCCYERPHPLPRLTPLPALANGFVTFGSFHRPEKLSPELFRLWAAVLHRVPRSQLLFHHVFGGTRHVAAHFQQPIREAFSHLGISPRRLRFVGRRNHQAHFDILQRADIALDAFPYHGMTTTCDGFAVGVPTVTYAGLSHVSRVGVSLLKAVGLDDWIARSPEHYLDLAVSHAHNLANLARLRNSLPRRLRRSPLIDARGYTAAVEQAYLDLVSGSTWPSHSGMKARKRGEDVG